MLQIPDWNDFFIKLEEESAELSKNLPRKIAAKRMKFLKAIGASDHLNESESDISSEDEHLPYRPVFLSMFDTERSKNLFDDSIVISDFKNIKHPGFDIQTYISCVKNLYADNICEMWREMFYLLCNARDFNKPSRNFLRFSRDAENEVEPPTPFDAPLSAESPFAVKLVALMDDLLVNYEESKYIQLNLNVTYVVLFMVRKLFKSETGFENALRNPKCHENYRQLCPLPLCDSLPDDKPLLNKVVALLNHDRKKLMTLVLYAFHKSARLSRRVLLTTCIAQMKFKGLGLPSMFDQVVQLYRAPESRLWDALCMEDTCEALFALADFHHAQKEGESQVPSKSYILFPYCRVLDQFYHADLSCSYKKNYRLSYLLAYLIDKKIGFDKSQVRNSMWTKDDIGCVWRPTVERDGDFIYDKINRLSK